MRGAVLHAPHDVRFEEVPEARILKPTDAIVRLAATCICGSDLWPYRGVKAVEGPNPMGHEYCGVVEEVGRAVTSVKPGQFVIGSFFASDSTLVATPGLPADDLVPSLLALSDVMGTGWFAAVAADVKPGKVVVVIGDGAVGLLGVLASRQLGAERIIVMSRHPARQALAREFGATDIVPERGVAGVAAVKELTDGVGAGSVLECVGTQESMTQAIRCARPGGSLGFVGLPHGVSIDLEDFFYTHVRLHGGPAPVRRFLPHLIELVWSGTIHPGRVFDLTLPLDQVAEGYRAMDERRAIKTLLRP